MDTPLNWTVAVVVCPECDEPVIADLPLSTNMPEPRALIRHHVLRQADGDNVSYCIGSKRQLPPCVTIDPAQLRRQEPDLDDGVQISFRGANRNEREPSGKTSRSAKARSRM